MYKKLHQFEHATESVTPLNEPSETTLRNIMLYANVIRAVRISANKEIIYCLN
ncbi:MAG: hypothetical protein LBV75_02625 [Paludibacter sp.]|jgi:hypothetical protein|nr:hypothetical protein [Paludibacter sp.]